MAQTVIDLDPFDPVSISRAEQILRERLRVFDENVNLFLERLAEIGRDAAQSAYGGGGAVNVTVSPIDNGYEIRADGRAVVFLEFGAGASVNTGNRYADTMPFEVGRGTYSDQNTGSDGKRPGEYARTGYQYWHFGGVKYTEVQPRNGMEHAYEAIMQNMRQAAREVFGT